MYWVLRNKMKIKSTKSSLWITHMAVPEREWKQNRDKKIFLSILSIKRLHRADYCSAAFNLRLPLSVLTLAHHRSDMWKKNKFNMCENWMKTQLNSRVPVKSEMTRRKWILEILGHSKVKFFATGKVSKFINSYKWAENRRKIDSSRKN